MNSDELVSDRSELAKLDIFSNSSKNTDTECVHNFTSNSYQKENMMP